MSTAWNYVGFFGVMAWLLFSYGTGIKFDRFQVHGGWVVTVLGLVSGILAGLAALGTPIYSFVGAIAHSFTPVSFALFLGVVVAVGADRPRPAPGQAARIHRRPGVGAGMDRDPHPAPAGGRTCSRWPAHPGCPGSAHAADRG
jgi:hypothetical protein